MSPSHRSSQYAVAVIIALLSVAAYFLTSSFPHQATSIESVAFHLVDYALLLYLSCAVIPSELYEPLQHWLSETHSDSFLLFLLTCTVLFGAS